MGFSLLHGWLPVGLQVATIITLLAAIGWRTARWRTRWLPVALAGGVLAGVLAWVYRVQLTGDTDPMPVTIWIWLAATFTALLVLVIGWTGAQWWRRGTAVLAVFLAALTCANTVNKLVAYYPTLNAAINDWRGTPIPGQRSLGEVRHSVGHRSNGELVSVAIPSTYSGFPHRNELVYLPPAWFERAKRPTLPAIEMITSNHGSPSNWIRIGGALRTVDLYAARHGGWAPILVFADPAGDFFTDTECVNGPRGNAENHLVYDIPRFVERTFHASANPADWGVLGFSMGGTCAVDLAVEHPTVFQHFVDMSGDIGPNDGNKAQTIAHLYGGLVSAWRAHDPLTVLGTHPLYPRGMSGRFEVGSGEPIHVAQADDLARAASADGIQTMVVVRPGDHDWTFATRACADALPWLADQVGHRPAARTGTPYESVRHDVTSAHG
jgi:enterochelin esterase-like enzyme